MVHFVCALKCEAAPIIEYYKLSRMQKAGVFSIYVNSGHDISLTITGIGKLAAAAATTYSYTMMQCLPGDVWINLGMAGHRTHAIGDIYLADRIEDAASAQAWYPRLAIETDIPRAGLLSLDQPSKDYADVMFDMEAAGFIASASRFTNAELTHSIKIISDNEETPAGKISARKATELVAAKKEQIVTLVSQLKNLSTNLKL